MANEKRLIDANALITNLHAFKGLGKMVAETLVRFVEKQPTVDAVEVVHGRWLLEREPDGKPYCFHCSVCDGDFSYIGITTAYNYCPNCGAKMDGGKKDG